MRLIIDSHPGERIVNVRLPEPPQRGEIIELHDGTRVVIKKLRAPSRGDSVDAYAYAKLVGR